MSPPRKIQLVENGINCVLLRIVYEDTYTSVRLTNLELKKLVTDGAEIAKARIQSGLMDIEAVLQGIRRNDSKAE